MNIGLAETISKFGEVYQRLFSDAERPERLKILQGWIDLSSNGGIPAEIRAMNDLLVLLQDKKPDRIRKYLQSGEYNTLSCGYYKMPVRGFNFCLHNETIPDHFRKILRLQGGCTSMPFYYAHEQEVNTLFFKRLQAQGKRILERCYDTKRQIITSDETFRQTSHDVEVKLKYLLGEADRLPIVQEIADDMKRVYGTVTQIIEGMTT